MVIGEGQKMPAAFIQPNFEFLEEWASRHNVGYKDKKDLVSHNIVNERYQEEIDHYNEGFGKWERVKKFELTPEEWTIEEGHLTPTMKLKRREIKAIYKNLFEKIYGPQH
jgi:long-chain acyl-CoA synthetase